MTEKKRIVCRQLDSGRITDSKGNDIDLSLCDELHTKKGKYEVKNGIVKYK